VGAAPLPACCVVAIGFSNLTFELSGRQRLGAGPARTIINMTVSRARCPADGAPLERWVRPRRYFGCMLTCAGKLTQGKRL